MISTHRSITFKIFESDSENPDKYQIDAYAITGERTQNQFHSDILIPKIVIPVNLKISTTI